MEEKHKYFTEQRLGLAWVRANKFIWDEEVFGPKPEGYDDLPMHDRVSVNKGTYILPKMDAVEKTLGRMATSKYWWLYELGHTEAEWSEWWVSQPYHIGVEDLYNDDQD